jgi:hypothetical protein
MPRVRKVARFAALLVALFTIVVGIAAIVSPDSMMTIRRSYYTPTGLYTGSAIRVGMGLVLILAASSSRWPRTFMWPQSWIPECQAADPGTWQKGVR